MLATWPTGHISTEIILLHRLVERHHKAHHHSTTEAVLVNQKQHLQLKPK
jgi:hypothetical protein